MAFQLLSLPKTHFVSPRIQVPETPGALESLSPYAPKIIECINNLVASFHFVGVVLQLAMNFQSQAYAGSYKSFAVLWTIAQLLTLVDASPRVLGRNTRVNGLYVNEVTSAVVAVADLVQAWMYRSVKVVEDDASHD
ncbi:hypothetical protein P691DRAFT_703344 [Macrolepiota fuliginosa MF-IS2]|uniref:Uncharacterized protein n=1 Tax=Macrolepiota fuliginosa MF-IS2 TaxID=1400762 RepID=A0A9P6C2A2_9AGAR|nr:hypothetical protein P691DRAFT_703344 [Macrolepiota fuliginosa MF-IS2]